jgi:hypothetical protein
MLVNHMMALHPHRLLCLFLVSRLMDQPMCKDNLISNTVIHPPHQMLLKRCILMNLLRSDRLNKISQTFHHSVINIQLILTFLAIELPMFFHIFDPHLANIILFAHFLVQTIILFALFPLHIFIHAFLQFYNLLRHSQVNLITTLILETKHLNAKLQCLFLGSEMRQSNTYFFQSNTYFFYSH